MKIRFTARAVRNLSGIADYLNKHNPAAAQRVQSAILDSVGILSRFPEIGRLQELSGVRKLVVRRYPYLIYYKVDALAEMVVILAIQHSARDSADTDTPTARSS